jgi:hypothetical protein
MRQHYCLLDSTLLKKEYSYTSTPPLGLDGLFYGQLYHIIISYF